MAWLPRRLQRLLPGRGWTGVPPGVALERGKLGAVKLSFQSYRSKSTNSHTQSRQSTRLFTYTQGQSSKLCPPAVMSVVLWLHRGKGFRCGAAPVLLPRRSRYETTEGQSLVPGWGNPLTAAQSHQARVLKRYLHAGAEKLCPPAVMCFVLWLLVSARPRLSLVSLPPLFLPCSLPAARVVRPSLPPFTPHQ